MIQGNRFIFSNSIAFNDLADYTISLSPDIGLLPPSEIVSTPSLFVDGYPYSTMESTAEGLGFSLHTRRADQDPDVWNTSIDAIRNEILAGQDFLGNPINESTFKFLITNRVNYRVSSDLFPGSKNYLATFKDCIYLSLVYDSGFAVFDNNFNLKIFDEEINSLVADHQLLYFNDSENIVETVAKRIQDSFYPEERRLIPVEEIYNLINKKEWVLIRRILLQLMVAAGPTSPWTIIEYLRNTVFGQEVSKQIAQTSNHGEKTAEKIAKADKNKDIVIFDLGMLYELEDMVAETKYVTTCDEMELTPNVRAFHLLRNSIISEFTEAHGFADIPEQYNTVLQMIGRIILKKTKIYLDSELDSIGWNNLSHATLLSSVNLLSDDAMDWRKYDTIGDIIQDISK